MSLKYEPSSEPGAIDNIGGGQPADAALGLSEGKPAPGDLPDTRKTPEITHPWDQTPEIRLATRNLKFQIRNPKPLHT